MAPALRVHVRTERHDAVAGLAGIGDQRLDQPLGEALALERGIDAGVVGDDQRGGDDRKSQLRHALGQLDDEAALGAARVHFLDNGGVRQDGPRSLREFRPR